ncbi:hypothetical protein Gpo141_00001253 [Globisporangium polare]
MCARLHEIATREFPASRGVEQRIDVYLALNELLKAEDTREFVQALCEHLPALLPEFHDDLQHATAKDLIHVCLRTLSYFMFHGTLAAKVPDAQLSTFLSDIVSLLFSTQDESTYKLCLWSLTKQNIEESRHPFLQRILEAFVQAIVNPFRSRKIELQAMEGLRELMLKYPQVALESEPSVQIWLKLICSRLTSSHKAIWEQSRLILKDASRHVGIWSPELLEMLQDCMIQYAFPAMKTHMDKQRNRDALQLWILILLLMKSNEWFFKKSVVQLLVRPIMACIEEETLLNVHQAAFITWKNIVSALVEGQG